MTYTNIEQTKGMVLPGGSYIKPLWSFPPLSLISYELGTIDDAHIGSLLPYEESYCISRANHVFIRHVLTKMHRDSSASTQ